MQTAAHQKTGGARTTTTASTPPRPRTRAATASRSRRRYSCEENDTISSSHRPDDAEPIAAAGGTRRTSGSRAHSSPENFRDTKSKAGLRRPYLSRSVPVCRKRGISPFYQFMFTVYLPLVAAGATTEVHHAHVAHERAGAGVRDASRCRPRRCRARCCRSACRCCCRRTGRSPSVAFGVSVAISVPPAGSVRR